MALTDTKLRNLKSGDKAYQEADEGGLFVEVLSGGTKTFRLCCRMGGRGSRQEKVTLGDYPAYSLADARTWRDNCKALVEQDLSPMALKRGNPTPGDATLAPDEVGRLLRANYQSGINRAHKLALRLLILRMARKSERIEAKWEELDLEKGE
jgi:integrase